MNASLRALLAGFADVPPQLDREITGIQMDSRKVTTGDLFLACAGDTTHGAAYVDDAVVRGAGAIAMETDGVAKVDAIHLPQGDTPLIAVPDLRARAGVIAARFFENPSRKLRVIGVTGTNGKTSVSHFIATALSEEAPAGVIGTLGSGLVGELTTTGHTTPDPVSVQREFARQLALGARAVAMEVSSHGLHQGRVNGVCFEVAVFTNLTREHLDYHGDMETYATVKRALFDMPGLKAAVLNVDDPTGRAWRGELDGPLRVIGYGLDPHNNPDLLAENLVLDAAGVRFEVTLGTERVELAAPLIGRFNVSNLLATLGALVAAGVPLQTAARWLAHLRAPAGRMERFGGDAGRPLVLVDYAHTPDALEQVLSAARSHTRGRLICVFGCGGNRDRGKRPVMGEVAERLADMVVVTDDNPRFEAPEFIIEEILRGMTQPERVRVIRDRAQAIAEAVNAAGENDVVVVAGKGHETTQQIGADMFPFSDRAQVAVLLGQEVPHG